MSDPVRTFLKREGHRRHHGRCYSYCPGCKRVDLYDRLRAEVREHCEVHQREREALKAEIATLCRSLGDMS